MEEVLNAVNQGLRATGRAQAWGLDGWPFRGAVTGINAGARRPNNFAVVFELINAHGTVIGRQTLQTSGNWQLTQQGIRVEASDRRTLTFQNVDAHAITDAGMTVRVVSVNGMDAEAAARDGILQARTITQREININDQFRFSRGTIQGFANNASRDAAIPSVTIPDNIWGDPVIAIGNGAFDARRWGARRINRLTISNTVVTIGADAFRGNHLTSIVIPDSVRSIGAQAFWDERSFDSFTQVPGTSARPAQTVRSVANQIHITLGANVDLAGNPFRFGQNERWQVERSHQGRTWLESQEGFRGFDGFAAYYTENGRQAGTYSFAFLGGIMGGARWRGGAEADAEDMLQQNRQRNRRNQNLLLGLLLVASGVVIVNIISNGLPDLQQ